MLCESITELKPLSLSLSKGKETSVPGPFSVQLEEPSHLSSILPLSGAPKPTWLIGMSNSGGATCPFLTARVSACACVYVCAGLCLCGVSVGQVSHYTLFLLKKRLPTG